MPCTNQGHVAVRVLSKSSSFELCLEISLGRRPHWRLLTWAAPRSRSTWYKETWLPVGRAPSHCHTRWTTGLHPHNSQLYQISRTETERWLIKRGILLPSPRKKCTPPWEQLNSLQCLEIFLVVTRGDRVGRSQRYCATSWQWSAHSKEELFQEVNKAMLENTHAKSSAEDCTVWISIDNYVTNRRF